MRTLAVICALVLLALQVNAGVISQGVVKRSTTKELIDLCQEASTLTSEEVNKKYFGITFLPEDNGTVTAFLGCIGEKTGIIDSKGVVDYAKTVDLIISINNNNETDVVTERFMKLALFHAAHSCRDSATQPAAPGLTVTRAFNCLKKGVDTFAGKFSEMYKNTEACVGLNELSKDEVNRQYKAGDILGDGQNLIVIFSCIGKQLDFVDANKVVNYEDVKDLLMLATKGRSEGTPLIDKSALDKAINSCKDQPAQGETAEQILLYTFNCIFEKLKSE